MNLSALGQRAIGQSQLYLKKHGPAILTATGVLGFVGTTVLVARAAVKAKPELEAIKQDLYSVEHRPLADDYTKSDKGNDYAKIIMHGVRDLGRIYAPAVILGAISITCVVSAHGMLKKQNSALVAAYGALDVGFKAYRKRVVEELGAEKERDIYRGVVALREEVMENGEVCQINEYGEVIPAASIYGRFFDEYSTMWSKTPEYNLVFLKSQQNWANDRLKARGHLFLNEVYENLGFSWTQAGQVVGWKYYPKGDNPKGDNYVDFGIHNIADEVSRAFVNGFETVIFLDFNVDGPISID